MSTLNLGGCQGACEHADIGQQAVELRVALLDVLAGGPLAEPQRADGQPGRGVGHAQDSDAQAVAIQREDAAVGAGLCNERQVIPLQRFNRR